MVSLFPRIGHGLSRLVAMVVSFLFLSQAASAAGPPTYDAFMAAEPKPQLAPSYRPNEFESPLLHPDKRLLRDERLQIPTFLWAAPDLPRPKDWKQTDLETTARHYLQTFAPFYRLDEAGLETALVRYDHDIGWGPLIVKFKQRIHGIDVFRKEQSVTMTRDRELVAISGNLSPWRRTVSPGKGFVVEFQDAIAVAFADLTGEVIAPQSLVPDEERYRYRYYDLAPPSQAPSSARLLRPARSKQVYYEMPNRLVPGFYVELNTSAAHHHDSLYYAYVISAEDGSVLFRNSLSAYAHNESEHAPNAFSYRVWADPNHSNFPNLPYLSPHGDNGYPHPTADPFAIYRPPFVDPVLITLASGPISTGDPWLAPDATTTKGNNADVFVDLVKPLGFNPIQKDSTSGELRAGDLRVPLSSPGHFDWTFNPFLAPDAAPIQQYASATSLFYAINFLHDIFYDLGFNEAAGNAQGTNFGRGGLDGDPLIASFQSVNANNKASIATPTDGGSPHMELSIHTDPPDSHARVDVILPENIAPIRVSSSGIGLQSFNVTGDLVYIESASHACLTLEPSVDVQGKIVLFDQGPCSDLLDGDDLRLMSVTNLEELPTAGRELVIIAEIDKLLHLRIFDDHGEQTADTGETELAEFQEVIDQIRFVFNQIQSQPALLDVFKPQILTQISLQRFDRWVNRRVASDAMTGAIGALVIDREFQLTRSFHDQPAPPFPVLVVGNGDGQLLKQLLQSGPVTINMSRSRSVNRDIAIDNSVVFHEWGHYLTQRLVADSNGLSGSQANALGEGWCDFVALSLSLHEADRSFPSNQDFQGTYGEGAYAWDQWYFGVRRYPLSTDLKRNPLTLKHIEDGVALPAFREIPFDNRSIDNDPNSQKHRSGEVWAVTLWDGMVGLLNDPRHTFNEAQNRTLSYLVASLKITPPAPTFVEARDALLTAITAGGDEGDLMVFDRAFAKRGLGKNAQAPPRDSTDHAGVVESFEPEIQGRGNLEFVSATLDDSFANCDNDGVLDPGETGRLTFTLRNRGPIALSSTIATVTSVDPVVLENEGQLEFPPTNIGDFTTSTMLVSLNGPTPTQEFNLEFTFLDTGPVGAEPRQLNLRLGLGVTPIWHQSDTDDVENGGMVGWFRRPDFGGEMESAPLSSFVQSVNPRLADWQPTPMAPDQSNHVWLGKNVDFTSDYSLESPLLTVGNTEPLRLTFRHRFEFEPGPTEATSYDGGVVEWSIDGGQSWFDAGEFASVGYNKSLAKSAGHPFVAESGVRPIYGNRSPNYPEFLEETFDFGNQFAGKSIMIRFRIGTDRNTGATGWEIDDIRFTGLAEPAFAILEPDPDPCTPRPQINIVPLTRLFTTEAGDTATFNVALNTPPSAPVTVSIRNQNASKATVAPVALTFPPQTWSDPQQITVTGIDDGRRDGTVIYELQFVADSADAAYASLQPVVVQLHSFESKDSGAKIPELMIERRGDSQLRLSWQDSSAEFLLQSANTIDVAWEPSGLETQIEGDGRFIIIPIESESHFYRLIRP